jgi:hypothetical protein
MAKGNKMLRFKGRILINILFIIFFIVSCDLPWEPGPQPSYLDNERFQPKLNILGIIRPGNIVGHPLSFIHLERSHGYLNFPDSLEVGDAQVRLFLYDGTKIIDSTTFRYTNFGGIFATHEYRSMKIDTIAGRLARKTFGISCKRSGYPELAGQTTVPEIPAIVDANIEINNGEIKFSILRDDLVGVYDVYLRYGQQQINVRFIRPEQGNTSVKLGYNQEETTTGELTVYAYDLNLSKYITYNIIIKPQTYQTTYSTVENGYGCFGSLNILEQTLNFIY